MLTSVGLGVFIACVIYVAIWSVKNDGARSIEDQDGFIRMRAWKRPAAPAAKRHTSPSPAHRAPPPLSGRGSNRNGLASGATDSRPPGRSAAENS